MTQEIINIGSSPNDGAGDPLRTAFEKINTNFSQLFATNTGAIEVTTTGLDTQVLFEVPVETFTQGKFEINSVGANSQSSQNIILSGAITNDNLDVKFTAYGGIFNGAPISRYDMDVDSGNVRVLCVPLADITMQHYIVFQVGFVGNAMNQLVNNEVAP